MGEKKEDPQEYIDAYEVAVLRTWEEVKLAPHLVSRRETQLHVLLGHHLLTELETKKLRRWKDYDILFDTPDTWKEFGELDWGIYGELRPDIVIIPKKKSIMGLVVELKTLELFPKVNKKTGEESASAVYQGAYAWRQDREKLGNVVNSFRGNRYIGAQIGFAAYKADWPPAKRLEQRGFWTDTYHRPTYQSVAYRDERVRGEYKSWEDIIDKLLQPPSIT